MSIIQATRVLTDKNQKNLKRLFVKTHCYLFPDLIQAGQRLGNYLCPEEPITMPDHDFLKVVALVKDSNKHLVPYLPTIDVAKQVTQPSTQSRNTLLKKSYIKCFIHVISIKQSIHFTEILNFSLTSRCISELKTTSVFHQSKGTSLFFGNF